MSLLRLLDALYSSEEDTEDIQSAPSSLYTPLHTVGSRRSEPARALCATGRHSEIVSMVRARDRLGVLSDGLHVEAFTDHEWRSLFDSEPKPPVSTSFRLAVVL